MEVACLLPSFARDPHQKSLAFVVGNDDRILAVIPAARCSQRFGAFEGIRIEGRPVDLASRLPGSNDSIRPLLKRHAAHGASSDLPFVELRCFKALALIFRKQ